MAYKKSDELHYFDLYPKVFRIGRETEIHIRPLGGREVIKPNAEIRLEICGLDGGDPDDFPASAYFCYTTAKANEKGELTFFWTFPEEQEYFIRLVDENNRTYLQFSVFAVNDDLVGRYPFIGDLHMHTTLSDGSQVPEVVAANYRQYGYDFTVISDHRRYYPSLRAIRAYKDVPIEMTIVPGEEVHMPDVNGVHNDVHIVNFGGEYSINQLVESTAVGEVGKALETRAIRTENVPDVMTQEDWADLIEAKAAELSVPEKVDKIPAAMCKWVFDEIKKANGLGIFPHPRWRNNVNHVPNALCDWLFENHVFDAFEVLGGENYYEQNGFQTAMYYEYAAKGLRYPVVGSTDSHSSYESNANAFICETIVFAPENERAALIDAVKGFYSVAVDTISKEFRLVGERRFVEYGCFLLKNYFPLHDELCYEEGRLMKQYVTGSPAEREEAAATLSAIHGRVERLRKKYFAF